MQAIIYLLIKIVTPVATAVFIYLKKREILYMISGYRNFREGDAPLTPLEVSNKIDRLLKYYEK